jgi:hypothetical protein
MPDSQPAITPLDPTVLRTIPDRINSALDRYSGKDWNYSRIYLEQKPLSEIHGPYVLWCDLISTKTKQGIADLETVQHEVSWGDRHSNELGILEIISLRLNKALFETTSNEFWGTERPVVRVVRKQAIEQQGISDAFWYRVQEVWGEEFDNR